MTWKGTLVEWQTRHLATFLAASAFGGQEELMAAANKIRLRPEEEPEPKESLPDSRAVEARLMQAFGGRIKRGN